MPSRWFASATLLAALLAPLVHADAERVEFDTSDGVRIVADYYAPKPGKHAAPMVILLHMYGENRGSWKPLAQPLSESGFAVLALDMRGHGESATETTRGQMEKREAKLFRAMKEDVWAAYDWLAARKGVDRARFALVGASVGCSVALDYAGEDRSVDAIVCLSPGTNYLGLNSARDIAKVTGRKVLLMATSDERDACEKLKEEAEGVETRILDGYSAHGTRMFDAIPDVEKSIVDYLQKAVGPASDEPVFGSIKSEVYHPRDSAWIERIKPTNLRSYSSAKEAEARGLRASKSKGPDDGPRGKSDKRTERDAKPTKKDGP
ncbi:MAG: 2-succinyl-6-hydroxy-2,4-cyclohexadiene-1-carboxylate synthase [Phycisphaerae bacterium]|nr:2-succinyl-6-hydroxy-2,4-cyclohexadiene-1-carboxylate synthase [Phycisphaerae bacterium]